MWKNNPALVQLLGLCPLLAVTGSVVNALGLGLATMMVLACSNTAVSMIRNFTSDAIRLPAFVMIIASFVTCAQMGLSNNPAFAVFAGAVGGIIIGLVTEHYTGGKPVRDLAKQGETGVATVMIAGLALGMRSVAIPLLTLAATISVSFHFVGLYGVGLAAVGMLGTVGITMAIDAYGPVADNAGGIAEMAAMGPETRKIM